MSENIECHKCKKEIDAAEQRNLYINSFKRPHYHTRSIFIHCFHCLDEINVEKNL